MKDWKAMLCRVSDFKVFPLVSFCVQVEEMGLLNFQTQFDLSHTCVISEQIHGDGKECSPHSTEIRL